MEFSHSFPSVTFAVLTVDQAVEHGVELCQQNQRYRRGPGSNPGKPVFFRLSFRNCISCVNNCEDLLYIYSSFRRSHI